MIQPTSTDFLIVLPECVQLIMINLLLGFALGFTYGNPQNQVKLSNVLLAPKKPSQKLNNLSLNGKLLKPAFDLNQSSQDLFPKPDVAHSLVPYLQVEPITRLTLFSLVWCAAVYCNISLHYGFGFETLIWDHLSRIMSILVCVSSACALTCACDALKRFSRYEFILILWLSILGMLWLIKSANFLAFYLSIELQSLSFYMLATMRSRNEASAEAGLKYFILSAFSSAILLLGSTLIYGACGSQNFSDLALTLNHFTSLGELGVVPTSLTVGLGCVCVSLLFKLGAAPFHTWIADVYEGSQTAITAFSGVANVGWFLLALASGQWQLLVIHLMVYILLNLTLFSVILMPLFRTHPDLNYGQRVKVVPDYGADSLTIKYVSDLHQIAKINPSVGFALTIAMFSLAGLPPLAGFYSKYLIINSVTQSELYGVLALALATAVISAFYYVRVVRTIYFSSTGLAANRGIWFTLKEIPHNATLISWSCALTVCVFLKPDYFFIWLALG